MGRLGACSCRDWCLASAVTGGGGLPRGGCLASAVTGGSNGVNTYDNESARRRGGRRVLVLRIAPAASAVDPSTRRRRRRLDGVESVRRDELCVRSRASFTTRTRRGGVRGSASGLVVWSTPGRRRRDFGLYLALVAPTNHAAARERPHSIAPASCSPLRAGAHCSGDSKARILHRRHLFCEISTLKRWYRTSCTVCCSPPASTARGATRTSRRAHLLLHKPRRRRRGRP